MEWAGAEVALYGRFTTGSRERLTQAITAAGGAVVRDLTRRSAVLAVGGMAHGLIARGALARRLEQAQQRGVQVLGERRLAAALAGDAPGPPATFPIATALQTGPLTAQDAAMLAAFDVIRLEGDCCRFADAGVLRTASDLATAGCGLAEIVRILDEARAAPPGRRKLVLADDGAAALQWEDGLSTLDGQGLLALEAEHVSADSWFEAALEAEAEGAFPLAVRLFNRAADADRRDPLAPYNAGNLLLAQQHYEEAAIAYQRALRRDAAFPEARYNLAQALEALGRLEAAARELEGTLALDPLHPDALFNLAQLRLAEERLAEAETLYARFLATSPTPEWAEKARKGLAYCRGAGA